MYVQEIPVPGHHRIGPHPFSPQKVPGYNGLDTTICYCIMGEVHLLGDADSWSSIERLYCLENLFTTTLGITSVVENPHRPSNRESDDWFYASKILSFIRNVLSVFEINVFEHFHSGFFLIIYDPHASLQQLT